MPKEYQRKWFYPQEWNERVQLDKQICNEIVFSNNNANIDDNDKILINRKFSTDSSVYDDRMNYNHRDAKYNFLSIPEISINKLLLNYFITMGYENSSIRMCKELCIINSNKDIQDFNKLYMIQERNQIKNLIKNGKIMDAMDKIISNFGSNALENDKFDSFNKMNNSNSNNNNSNNNNSNDEVDLQFKLLLLNLIEMIREHNKLKEINIQNNNYDIDDKNFILDLINYSKEQLASKASQNKQQMNELQLTMSLLLFTKANPENTELPAELNELYSLQFRSEIAEQINKKLLSLININVENQSKFPNLIFNNLNLNSNSINLYQILNTKNSGDSSKKIKKSSTATATTTSTTQTNTSSHNNDSIENHFSNNSVMLESNIQPLNNIITNKTKYWSETQKYLNLDNSIDNSQNEFDDNDFNSIDNSNGKTIFDNNFEAKLIQLFKLWCYSENTLHLNNIGVPRVKDTFD